MGVCARVHVYKYTYARGREFVRACTHTHTHTHTQVLSFFFPSVFLRGLRGSPGDEAFLNAGVYDVIGLFCYVIGLICYIIGLICYTEMKHFLMQVCMM